VQVRRGRIDGDEGVERPHQLIPFLRVPRRGLLRISV
jgi:hypothetical protein